MGSFIYFINAVSNKQRINIRNRYQAASIIIENLNLQKKFHTVSHYYLYYITPPKQPPPSFPPSSHFHTLPEL